MVLTSTTVCPLEMPWCAAHHLTMVGEPWPMVMACQYLAPAISGLIIAPSPTVRMGLLMLSWDQLQLQSQTTTSLTIMKYVYIVSVTRKTYLISMIVDIVIKKREKE